MSFLVIIQGNFFLLISSISHGIPGNEGDFIESILILSFELGPANFSPCIKVIFQDSK